MSGQTRTTIDSADFADDAEDEDDYYDADIYLRYEGELDDYDD